MKVMIVEDETVIRNGLAKHIMWKDFGINEVKAVENAEGAYLTCQDYIPDIVVSDISMPGENGVELCRKLRKSFPDIEIIFVTGYADKEYLKAAIDLHVVRYVEKPIDRDEVTEAIGEAVQRVKKAREQKSAYLHSLFFDSSALPFYISGKNIFRACILHLGQAQSSEMKEKLMKCLSSWLKDNDVNILAEISDSTTLSLLLCGKDKLPDIESVKEKLSRAVKHILGEEAKWFLALGKQVGKTENITDSWQSAQNVRKALAYMGWNCVGLSEDFAEKHKFEIDETIPDKFAEMISRKKKEEAVEILDAITQKLQADQTFLSGEVRHVFYALNSVLNKAEQTMWINDQSAKAKDKNFLETAETFIEINQYLKERILILLSDSESQKNMYVVKRVMDYIGIHYGNPKLSLNILSEYVYLAPPYLSSLFKKSVGITVGQYMLEVRIENAKRLMREPQLKFYQVSSMVGYEDANYFTKIFKKKTGMTPSEYKESLALK